MEKYYPGELPQSEDLAHLKRQLNEELRRISNTLNAVVDGHLDKVYQDVSKPRRGDFRYFASATLSAGQTEGVYFFSSAGAWTQWLSL